MLLWAATCLAQGPIAVSQVTQDKVGQTVEIKGTVKSFQASRGERSPNSFKLDDGAGSIRVAIWPNVFDQIAQKQAITEGATVRVKGKVSEFRGNLEIHVDSPADLTVEGAGAAPAVSASSAPAASAAKPAATPAAAAPAAVAPAASTAGAVTPIAQITNDKLNQRFTIEGTVASARAPSSDRAPYILKVKDATGSIDVVFWKDLADKLSDAQKVNEGDAVRVSGKLGEFRGSLQLKPESPADIQKSSNPAAGGAAPGPSATQQGPQAGAVTAPAADFASAPNGATVEITGKVVTVERLRLGQKITVTDGKTTWLVLVWANASGLRPAIERVRGGEDVRLRAKVQTVDGSKILVVTSPEDVLYVG
jgi:DNA/RNA endonuclease YhcR with UshA esterase domain